MQGKPDDEHMHMRVERLFGRPVATWTIHHHAQTWRPPTDVQENEQGFIVVVEAAGMQQGDFDINLVDNLLTITGTRPSPTPRGISHQLEINYGEFRTDIYVATAIDPAGIEAEYCDGFLTVFVPKARVHRIPVTAHRSEPTMKTTPPGGRASSDDASPSKSSPGAPSPEP